MRMCVFHSPYSTVSASSAHVIVFSSAMLAPMTNRPTIANWMFVLATYTISAPTSAVDAPDQEAALLAEDRRDPRSERADVEHGSGGDDRDERQQRGRTVEVVAGVVDDDRADDVLGDQVHQARRGAQPGQRAVLGHRLHRLLERDLRDLALHDLLGGEERREEQRHPDEDEDRRGDQERGMQVVGALQPRRQDDGQDEDGEAGADHAGAGQLRALGRILGHRARRASRTGCSRASTASRAARR